MERAATFGLKTTDKALGTMPTGAIGASVEAGAALLFFIDRQGMGRDCITQQLQSLLSEWRVEPISEAIELHRHANWAPSSILILSTHGKSISDPEVAGEMAILVKLVPALPILVMSERCHFSEVTLAFGLGARGYLPTSLTMSEVTAIVRLVAQGGTYVPANILAGLFENHRSAPTQIPNETKSPCSFSPRQLHVLERLNEGKPNKVIAYELGMAESTVKVHIRHIMKKLSARNRTQIVLMTKDALRVRSTSVADSAHAPIPGLLTGYELSAGK
jgi:DNA-binding NarL/FixJ family response regulator